MEINNRKVKHDYQIFDTYEAGIVLKGTEIKSIRAGKANLKDSYATIKNGEAMLLNMHISPYEQGNIFNHEETRTRKLLLHKKEILKLRDKIKLEGYTLVPIKLYFKNGKAKILIGVAKGKKNYDKRETIKQRDIERDIKAKLKYQTQITINAIIFLTWGRLGFDRYVEIKIASRRHTLNAQLNITGNKEKAAYGQLAFA